MKVVLTPDSECSAIVNWSFGGSDGWLTVEESYIRVIVSGVDGAWREIKVNSRSPRMAVIRALALGLGMPHKSPEGIFGSFATA